MTDTDARFVSDKTFDDIDDHDQSRFTSRSILSAAEVVGPDHPIVLQMISDALHARGLLTSEEQEHGVQISREELASLIYELANAGFGKIQRANWNGEDREQAMTTSNALAHTVMKDLTRVAIHFQTLHESGVFLHPQHSAILLDCCENLSQALEFVTCWPTTRITPEPTVSLDPITFDEAQERDEFVANYKAIVEDKMARLSEGEAEYVALLKEGIDPEEAFQRVDPYDRIRDAEPVSESESTEA